MVIHILILLYILSSIADVSFALVAPPYTRSYGRSRLEVSFTGRRPSTSSPSSFAPSSSTQRRLAAAAVANPFKNLPWNVRKEQEREARRLKLERVKLHRQLGIAEDATYEEIVAATDRLVAAAGGNLKQKVLIEVAKDKILQYRLSERLAGYVKANAEARAQSDYEVDGVDEDEMVGTKKGKKEFNTPVWTKGLIVKPDRKHLIGELRLWGIITLLGAALPPVQEYLGRFTWLICIAQLTFRGMPKEVREQGGMGFNSGGGGHRKVAFGLGFMTWVVGAIITYGMMPAWARGQRWTGTVAFTMQNMFFFLATCYLQPYKGR